MTTTRALATFGVYRGVSDAELAVLTLADDFREQLCTLWHARHRAEIDYRNEHYPQLYAALVRQEQLFWRIVQVEAAIKAHHSEVRNRNAVPDELREQLEQARAERKTAQAIVSAERREYAAFLKRFREAWRNAADWKNVKSLDKRHAAYAAIDWPAEFAAYAALVIYYDLAVRELGIEYQSRGLHWAIRGEIVEASKPKIGKTGPGMRYEYHRAPEPRPWGKLTLQIPGGLTVAAALAGECASLRIECLATRKLTSRTHTFYRVTQQIGTTAEPRAVTYTFKAHVPLPPEGIIQRWSLVVRDTGKREVILIMKANFAKPIGNGAFSFKLGWTRRKAGIEVCRFWGVHVSERLIVPMDTVAQRLAVATAQAAMDRRANELLAERGVTPRPNERQGVLALARYTADHAADNAAANLLWECQRDLRHARQVAKRAERRIEKIYETVASRVCRLHSEVVRDPIPLDKIKLYDGRDLLREDRLPLKSRMYLHAVAPGKLRALIDGYGLASGEVALPEPGDARETDVFTSYIAALGQPDCRQRAGKRHRSRSGAHNKVVV